MRKTIQAFLAVGLVVLVGLPVYAAIDDSGAPTRNHGFEASTDVGSVRASWTEWGNDVTVEATEPDWFMCRSFGTDVAMPTAKLQGVDTLVVSGQFEEADFGDCYGTPPTTISFEFEIQAEVVIRAISDSKYTEHVLKGDVVPMDYSRWTSSLQGSEAAVNGTILGTEVGSTNWAEYTFQETR